MGLWFYFRKTVSVFFEYDTVRVLHIESKRIGIISRLIQLVIIAYILGYVLYWKKGYQETCPVSSTVTTKVKGVVFSNLPNFFNINEQPKVDFYKRIWDPIDVVFPASGEEQGGFFITTNVIITPNQKRDRCLEDPNIEGAKCKVDGDCKYGDSIDIGNGVFTGRCLPNSNLHNTKTCEIFAWCPVENEELFAAQRKKALLEESKNFKVLIKNTINFEKFGSEYFRRNIMEQANSTYLQRCIYDPKINPFCPVFKIEDIVRGAGESYDKITLTGAVFKIHIHWDCNLDWNFMKYCLPKYTFERKDNPNAKIAPGWNFRYATYHEEDKRTLYKMYGIKFIIEVDGEGRKFGFAPLLLNLGSGLALLGLAPIFCDLIVMYFLKDKELFKSKKYYNLKGGDAFRIQKKQKEEKDKNFEEKSLNGLEV